METLIITNNPRVEKELREAEKIEFHPQAGQEEILRLARDYIHLGAKLIMHPMMGRVKPVRLRRKRKQCFSSET